MALLHYVFLLSLLSLTVAKNGTLTCYHGKAPNYNRTNCAANVKFCVTLYSGSKNNATVSKGCDIPPYNACSADGYVPVGVGQNKFYMDCCSSDDCNCGAPCKSAMSGKLALGSVALVLIKLLI
ncbi:hypothetical protein L596_009905 [Steinernema carpocapsae]|uniref:Snake toxin/toxin-like domain-containing protein n=1 Tax=Steinernema carpocapsae TaxID=34508 RepID=A0A4U5PHI3_STECR|nr:hypothetical protein L596_009905 [Steinernema carpocapsae]